MEARDAIEHAREAFARRAWVRAYRAFAKADRSTALQPQDLERFSTAAYMLGMAERHLAGLKRAYRGHLDAGGLLPAARCAFWAGIALAMRGQTSHAAGWFGRAQRLVERHGSDSVECGYLLIPGLLQNVAARNWKGTEAVAAQVETLAERFDDADLFALAAHERGHALVCLGKVEQGLALIDEVMVSVTAGELSPVVTGLVYCSVIGYCQELFQLGRARAWTEALSDWCAQQPEMIAHTGQCFVHRAEIMQLHGAWSEALEEARRAKMRLAVAGNQPAAGHALYRRAEVYRLQGKFAMAESAYRDASRSGYEPQPGLALLRLVQGKVAAASGAARRMLAETTGTLQRAKLLPACIEILLAGGDLEEARAAYDDLEKSARGWNSILLDAVVAQSRGALELAEGKPGTGLAALRRALAAWQELGAPYEAARLRLLMAQACRAMGDEETAALELEAARSTFSELGAEPDLAQADTLAGRFASVRGHGLTPREIQVLCGVAAGKTNKAIARELAVSGRTVDRHVSNIFDKLGVSSRAAATALAYRSGLV